MSFACRQVAGRLIFKDTDFSFTRKEQLARPMATFFDSRGILLVFGLILIQHVVDRQCSTLWDRS